MFISHQLSMSQQHLMDIWILRHANKLRRQLYLQTICVVTSIKLEACDKPSILSTTNKHDEISKLNKVDEIWNSVSNIRSLNSRLSDIENNIFEIKLSNSTISDTILEICSTKIKTPQTSPFLTKKMSGKLSAKYYFLHTILYHEQETQLKQWK